MGESMSQTNLKAEFGDQIVESYKKMVLGMRGPRSANGKKVPNEASARIKKFFNKIAGERGEGWDVEGREFVHLEPKYVDREELIGEWRL